MDLLCYPSPSNKSHFFLASLKKKERGREESSSTKTIEPERAFPPCPLKRDCKSHLRLHTGPVLASPPQKREVSSLRASCKISTPNWGGGLPPIHYLLPVPHPSYSVASIPIGRFFFLRRFLRSLFLQRKRPQATVATGSAEQEASQENVLSAMARIQNSELSQASAIGSVARSATERQQPQSSLS